MTATSAVTVRPATVEDAEGIATVHVRSWQVTYRGHLPDTLLDGLSVQRRKAGWEAAIGRAGWTTLVAQTPDGPIGGFALVGPNRDDDGAGRGELMALYLDPDRWSHGWGRALHVAAVAALVAGGYSSATLWVLDVNDRARRFYERAGWVADGSVKDDDVGDGVITRDLRYVRDLAHPPV